jgi:hypothetical protein
LLSDIGFPGANEPSTFTAPRIDHDVNTTAYLAQAPDSCLTVITAIIYVFKNLAVEHGKHIDEIDLVLLKVLVALVLIPFEWASHSSRRLPPTFLMLIAPNSTDLNRTQRMM